MNWKITIAFVAFLLVVAAASPMDDAENLRGTGAAGGDNGRKTQVFMNFFAFAAPIVNGLVSFISSIPQLIVNFISSIPQLIIDFILFLLNFLWNAIFGVILFFSSSTFVTTTSTGTISTMLTSMTTASVADSASSIPATTMATMTSPTNAMATTIPTMATGLATASESTSAAVSATSSSPIPSATTRTTTPISSTTMSSTSSTTASMTTTTSSTSTTTMTTTGVPTPKYVFITLDGFNGNLGGLDGADAKCTEVAANANLTGTFRAWLSNETSSPSTRFFQNPIEYIRLDNATIADNYTSLVTSGLLNLINLDEFRAGSFAVIVWTNTKSDGTPIGTGVNDCDGWTSSSSGMGNTGNPMNLGTWTDAQSALSCSSVLPLYCFEQ